MKRVVSAFAIIITLLSILTISSCGIIDKVNNAVIYPDEYSITYEITSSEGTISSITKTVDKNGNVYFITPDEEKLYINDSGAYTLYERDENGVFGVSSSVKYTREAVEEATSAIKEYTEKSKDKFIPTAKKDGESVVAGRACDVYKIGVGGKNNSSYNYYYVDTETGICLGVDVKQTALGEAVEYKGDRFICLEFITENIENLANKI